MKCIVHSFILNWLYISFNAHFCLCNSRKSFVCFCDLKMNQFPQIMPHTMGMTPQFAPGTMMPGTGMFLPPPPIGLPLGVSPGKNQTFACIETFRVYGH